MWARYTELFLSLWLFLSPFIFPKVEHQTPVIVHDCLFAILIASFSFLSFFEKLYRMHLLNVGMSIWMIAYTFLAVDSPPPGAYQNFVGVGLILIMLAIIPVCASAPTCEWQEFLEKKGL